MQQGIVRADANRRIGSRFQAKSLSSTCFSTFLCLRLQPLSPTDAESQERNVARCAESQMP